MNTINKIQWPHKQIDIPSAWKGLEDYIIPIINHFNIKQNKALEFGVDRGYSSAILSQVFNTVIGVDSFIGDFHINHIQDESFYNNVVQLFKDTNVNIVKSSFEDYIKHNNENYDLIHIDIVHEYAPTFMCADWSILHSNVVILHDTISFPEVYKVCQDISAKHNVEFLNIPEHYGLGILYKQQA